MDDALLLHHEPNYQRGDLEGKTKPIPKAKTQLREKQDGRFTPYRPLVEHRCCEPWEKLLPPSASTTRKFSLTPAPLSYMTCHPHTRRRRRRAFDLTPPGHLRSAGYPGSGSGNHSGGSAAKEKTLRTGPENQSTCPDRHPFPDRSPRPPWKANGRYSACNGDCFTRWLGETGCSNLNRLCTCQTGLDGYECRRIPVRKTQSVHRFRVPIAPRGWSRTANCHYETRRMFHRVSGGTPRRFASLIRDPSQQTKGQQVQHRDSGAADEWHGAFSCLHATRVPGEVFGQQLARLWLVKLEP
jgi:hypothetical protein